MTCAGISVITTFTSLPVYTEGCGFKRFHSGIWFQTSVASGAPARQKVEQQQKCFVWCENLHRVNCPCDFREVCRHRPLQERNMKTLHIVKVWHFRGHKHKKTVLSEAGLEKNNYNFLWNPLLVPAELLLPGFTSEVTPREWQRCERPQRMKSSLNDQQGQTHRWR